MERPRLVYDGDCGFCRRWVLRWRRETRDRVELRPYQEAADEHPEVPSEDFRRWVHFFDGEGGVFRGAEAVFRALALAPDKRWLLWAYEHVPGWRHASECVYRVVARHRTLASRILTWTVGRDITPPTWRLSRRVFLSLLGLVYAVAFVSLWSQLGGLFGSRGIAPVAEYLGRAHEVIGTSDWGELPTLFWLDASDGALHAACGTGLALAVLLMLGVAPRVIAFLLWAVYLSFVRVGYPFLNFQWDVLLLETGLLAVVFAPSGLRPFGRGERPPSAVARFLLRWLLFRLMFLSGAVKLASHDPTWWDLTALQYHYWTQPLPHALSHYAHHLPASVHAFSTAVMFAIELGLPFLVFGPRRLRHLACGGILLLMALITATGNYGFFNLLTVALCVVLLDDRVLRRLLPFLRGGTEAASAGGGPLLRLRQALLGVFAVAVVALTAAIGAQRTGWMRALPAVVQPLGAATARLASFNAYGLFANMTEERPEIVIEGSEDGRTWRPYRFRWKPGDPERTPGFVGPHMPRLDWQMWFAALRGRPEGWYLSFMERLLAGSEPVLKLLADDPFDGDPPRYVRSTLYLYTFGTPEERRAGTWWRRTAVGPFGPTLTLNADGVLRALGPLGR